MSYRIFVSKKGLFFTIDALIAAIILIGGLLLVSSSYVSDQPRATVGHMAFDMLGILQEMQIHEVNNSYIQSLVDNGSITDVNKTLLGQIGEFWASGNTSMAEEFAMNVSEGILPSFIGYSILFDGETVYSRPVALNNMLVSAKKIVSGIQKSKPIKGFVARARATTVSKTTTLTIPFSPAGAGWKGSASNPGYVHVKKIFSLPSADVLEAKAYLSLHLDRGSPDWDIVTINDGLCTITRDDMDLSPGNEGVFRTFSLDTSCFVEGNNSISLDLRNLGYNAHIHPGTFFTVRYNLTEDVQMLSKYHSERIYFDNVLSSEGGGSSCAGPWVITPFHIPEDAENVSVAIRVVGKNINDFNKKCRWNKNSFWGWGWYRCMKNYDYIIFLNDDSPFDSDASPDSDPVYDYGPAEIASELIEGTNTISVYFNNYGDDCWGEGEEQVYSDPEADPSGSSYVEVNYTLPSVLPYGAIEVRAVEEFGGSANPVKDTTFEFPSEADSASSVFVHPVEQYSYITRVFSGTSYPADDEIFESPSSRATPSEIMVPLSTIDMTPFVTDYVRIQETSGNDVLPNSTVDYGFYMRAFVGYQGVFSSYAEAVDDAVVRLEEVLGAYINASDIVVDNVTMDGVPSLWGPAIAEVRVWN